MNGYGSHTYRWVNEKGEGFWVKWHFKTQQKIKNFTGDEADKMKMIDPDFATRDLIENIQKGE